MIWQVALLSRAKDEDTALAVLVITVAGYIAWKLIFRSRVNSMLARLEALTAEGK